MDKNETITINGRGYDAHSGLPVDGKPVSQSTQETVRKKVAATDVHSRTQKSQTLNRKSTKKPVLQKTVEQIPAGRRSMDIARSRSISRFAPNPAGAVKNQATPKSVGKEIPDIAAVTHPTAARAHAVQKAKTAEVTTPELKSSKQIKEDAIATALAKSSGKEPKKRVISKHRKKLNIVAIIILVILIGGYVTYVNLPNLSVHIAAVRAGINATFPTYSPDGYSFDGPVTYSQGNVVINFKANTGDSKFSITQTKSSWDTTALQQMVNTDSQGQFITTTGQGLTVFSYNGNASWVNAGILYKIKSTGSVPLSSDQIIQIATSM